MVSRRTSLVVERFINNQKETNHKYWSGGSSVQNPDFVTKVSFIYVGPKLSILYSGIPTAKYNSLLSINNWFL